MKKILFILLLTSSSQLAFPQTDVIGTFNTNFTGRNIALTFKKDLNRHSLIFGAKYNINRKVHDNQNNFFLKRFYATKPIEHLGFNFEYHYQFLLNNSAILPFVFYDLQFTNSHIRTVFVTPYEIGENSVITYKKTLEFFGPTIALEHNIGIGLSAQLTNRLFLYQKIGAGIVTYINIDDRILGARNWEFGYLISVGLGYQLTKSP
jgi:opacity protein-like surface antigen